ncbi:MAG: cytochrome c biogenesis protein CcsA [bacterium]|nr:cytochrome c biogenesis protein CcsA [bacterium]
MKTFLPWLLWLWLCVVILAAFLWAPLFQGFDGTDHQSPQSGRILFFHVPTAIVSFIGFLTAAVWSVLYLWKRRPEADHASLAAIEVSLLFCALATITGAVWSKVQWGAYWNWDPRQTSMALALVFYAAYLTLRGAIEDPENRARISAAYAVLGFIVAPFLYFIMPRLAAFSLHPKPAGTGMDSGIAVVLIASVLGFTALFFWMQSMRRRILAIEGRAELLLDD